jgi:hypothetical protein
MTHSITTPEQNNNQIIAVNNQTESGLPHISGLLSNQQITDFQSLFIGRREVVALSTSFTTPVNGLSDLDKHTLNHLNGICRMGSYNFLPDGKVPWAMIEFEDHGAQKLLDPPKSVREAMEHLQSCGINSYLELSKNPSGNCYHLWIFFEQPLSAKKIHHSLKSFTKNVLGINTEVFPKGYNKDSIGNMVWLPLFPDADDWGMGMAQNRAVFIDPTGLPYPNQFEFIRTIQRVSDPEFDNFISEYTLPIEEEQKPELDDEILDADLQKVRTCAFMKHCEDNAVQLSEPEWYAWITNAIRCKGGREYIHQYSSKYPLYSRIKTDKKIAHALEKTGPMTHDKIAETTGFRCNCKERLKSPVSNSSYIDVMLEASRLKAIMNQDDFSNGIRALVRYINRQDPIEREIGKNIVKEVLKLNKSIFDEVNSKQSAESRKDLKNILASMKGRKADDVEKAKTIYSWLRDEKKAQYFTDDNNRHYIYLDQKLMPIDSESSDYQSLLLSNADVSVATQFGRVVIQVMNASTHSEGKRIQRNTWLETKSRKLEVFLNLKNGNNELLKITPNACCIVQNGNATDEVLMLDTLEDKLKPIEFKWQEDNVLKSSLEKCESLIVNHIPCIDHERWFAYAWRMSYPLYDFTTMHLILRAQGGPGMGKSTACKILTKSLYGEIYENKNTVASLYSDASINPLVVEDNLENKAFYVESGHADFYLSAATGGGKQKRDGNSGSGLIIEKIRSLLLCNGIESIAKSEQTSRMMLIECDKKIYNSGYSSGILLDIEKYRNEMLSAEFILTQRVLKRMGEGDWHGRQKMLEDKYVDHPKSRMFEHLAIMVLYLEEFCKASGNGLDVERLLTEWMSAQKISATVEIIESDPIIQALDIIRESAFKQHEYDTHRFGDSARKERPLEIKLDVRSLLFKEITYQSGTLLLSGTAGQLLSSFSSAVKVHLGSTFAYSKSRILQQRLISVTSELLEHGYSLKVEDDKHLKQKVFTIEWKPEKKEVKED